jgi:hypothetical protein
VSLKHWSGRSGGKGGAKFSIISSRNNKAAWNNMLYNLHPSQNEESCLFVQAKGRVDERTVGPGVGS